MKAVFRLLSGKNLNEREFCFYLNKKIAKTKRKFDIKTKSNRVYCLDDAAIEIIYPLFTNKKTSIKKSEFLFCLKKELELYSKFKKLKLNFIEYNGLKLKVSEMLNELEKKHPEIKYSVVNAYLQIKPL